MPENRWTPRLARTLLAAALVMAPAAGLADEAIPAATSDIVPLDQLMSVAPLPDIVQGSPDAPVTIIEYASMTCTHCAAFHDETWPALKAKYIDSGRAKFILREFPLDPLATAAFMLARCAGPEKRNTLVDELFAQQNTWVVDKPVSALIEIAKGNGMSEDEFDACLKNQDLYDKVDASRDKAAEAFAIDATPTFFVNGHKLVGKIALADFDHWLDPVAK